MNPFRVVAVNYLCFALSPRRRINQPLLCGSSPTLLPAPMRCATVSMAPLICENLLRSSGTLPVSLPVCLAADQQRLFSLLAAGHNN